MDASRNVPECDPTVPGAYLRCYGRERSRPDAPPGRRNPHCDGLFGVSERPGGGGVECLEKTEDHTLKGVIEGRAYARVPERNVD